jgi:hypothetical protein
VAVRFAMARLLFQHQQTQLKLILASLTMLVAVGCAKPANPTVAGAQETSLEKKLQGMTPEQRTEYVKSHMDEVAASASVGVPHKKS